MKMDLKRFLRESSECSEKQDSFYFAASDSASTSALTGTAAKQHG